MCPGWEGRARGARSAGDGQTAAASALRLVGLVFGDCGLWVGGKRCLAAPSPGGEGLCVAPAVAPLGWCWQMPHGSERGAAGVGAGLYRCLQGWWHRPGRPEPLCYIGCFSYLKQEAAAAEPAKCFVIIHPAGSSLGSRRAHRPTSFGQRLHPGAKGGNSQPRLSFGSWLGYPG